MLVQRIFKLTKPIIAAINGPATGVGITMTLPCDVRIASNNAKMGFVFAQRGIAPDACGSWFAPRIVGLQQALAKIGARVYYPAPRYCTDNGAMIAFAGCQRLLAGERDAGEAHVRARWPMEELSAPGAQHG